MMTDDEMIERLANDANERVHGRPLSCELDHNQLLTRKFWKSNINAIRASGFEVIDKDELSILRNRIKEYDDRCSHFGTVLTYETLTRDQTIQRLEHKIRGYEQECYEVDQVLGSALGCPHCPDENGNEDKSAPICTGESTPASLAAEAAKRICPPGWVCVDPEGEIDMDAEDAADAKVYITPGARYLDNTDDVIRAYLRAVRDMKEPGE